MSVERYELLTIIEQVGPHNMGRLARDIETFERRRLPAPIRQALALKPQRAESSGGYPTPISGSSCGRERQNCSTRYRPPLGVAG